MNKISSLLLLISALIPFEAFCQQKDSIIGRPYKSFDVSAFCKYRGFHPTSYLTDNNWDILCAFTTPGTAERLDTLDIPFKKSQLRLLEVGGLLSSDNGVYSTLMPIFGNSETQTIRRQSKEFADSIFPVIEPEIKLLVADFNKVGYASQSYSLIFSYLLDNYIWGGGRLPKYEECGDYGTWSGAFWAMHHPRSHTKIGTNGYGVIKQNWTDDLGYWLSSGKLLSFAKEIIKTRGERIENKEVIDALDGWGLIDNVGNILIPVMRMGVNDPIDVLCKSITTKLSDSVKVYCDSWSKEHNISSEKLAQVIFYHEVMWNLLEIMESKGIISMPPILRGEEVGKEHFGDICFIVLIDD